jgi:hypothetical protein
MPRRPILTIFTLLLAVAATAGIAVAQPASIEEFFIISSVDSGKGQLLLKRPTEVTQVMRVDRQTKYFDRGNNPIGLVDLRAGDTVFITSSRQSGVVLQVRKSPMTIAELHRRYLTK